MWKGELMRRLSAGPNVRTDVFVGAMRRIKDRQRVDVSLQPQGGRGGAAGAEIHNRHHQGIHPCRSRRWG